MTVYCSSGKVCASLLACRSFPPEQKKKAKLNYTEENVFFFETFQKMFVFFSCVTKNKKDVLTRKKNIVLFQKKNN